MIMYQRETTCTDSRLLPVNAKHTDWTAKCAYWVSKHNSEPKKEKKLNIFINA